MSGADSFYRIGKSHRVCQDYAEHENQGRPMAWLSDGCSSAPDTDWGARFLIRSARFLAPGSGTLKQIATHADTMTIVVGIDIECLNATLVRIAVEPEDLVATVVGDGVLVARTHCGGFETVTIEYPSGAPFYPRMSFCGLDTGPLGVYQQYLKKFGREYTVATSCDGVWGETEMRSLPDDPTNHADVFRFPRSGYDLLAAFSDGIHTFTRPVITDTSRSLVKIPTSWIIKEFLDFKSMKGDFVARRCQTAFKRFAAQGIEHSDDFSMAAVYSPEIGGGKP